MRSILICFFLGISLYGFAADIKISKFFLGKRFVYLSLSANVSDVISLSGIIEQGIPVNITYKLTLYQLDSSLFGDQKITNILLTYEAKRDVINDGYEVKGNAAGAIIGKWYSHWNDVESFLLTPSQIPVIDINFLKPNKVYVIEISQQITSIRLFPPLSWLYQMLGNWSYDSTQIRSRKFTKNGILME